MLVLKFVFSQILIVVPDGLDQPSCLPTVLEYSIRWVWSRVCLLTN